MGPGSCVGCKRSFLALWSCTALRIISAPSPVMEATNDRASYFYVHELAGGPDRRLALLASQRIDVPGASSENAESLLPPVVSHRCGQPPCLEVLTANLKTVSFV